MNKLPLNLENYLSILFNHKCVILKHSASTFTPQTGDDIDIVCLNPKIVLQDFIVASLSESRSGLIIRVSYGPPNSYIHFDFLDNDQIIIRFDFLLGYSHYQKIHPNSEFLLTLINTKKIKKNTKNSSLKIYIPDRPFEALVRYFDYMEHPGIPSKYKHLEFIKTKLTPDEKSQLRKLKNIYGSDH